MYCDSAPSSRKLNLFVVLCSIMNPYKLLHLRGTREKVGYLLTLEEQIPAFLHLLSKG
ncbi:Uncharacterised protein [Klebsiella oxytoca]|nr:Uncharacterised protein [Klebsiella oxytoca]